MDQIGKVITYKTVLPPGHKVSLKSPDCSLEGQEQHLGGWRLEWMGMAVVFQREAGWKWLPVAVAWIIATYPHLPQSEAAMLLLMAGAQSSLDLGKTVSSAVGSQQDDQHEDHQQFLSQDHLGQDCPGRWKWAVQWHLLFKRGTCKKTKKPSKCIWVLVLEENCREQKWKSQK